MELERINSNNKELELPVSSSSAISVLEKCDAQISALVKPEKPLPPVRRMVLKKGEVQLETEEKIALATSLGGIVPLLGGVFVLMEVNVGAGIPLIALGISSVILGLNAATKLYSGKKCLGYRVQKIWQKMGLPAKRLKAVESERLAARTQFEQDTLVYNAALEQVKERAKPALEIANKQSTKYRYSFGLSGLEGTLKPIEPVTWVERLAKELESSENVNQSENLSLESGQSL